MVMMMGVVRVFQESDRLVCVHVWSGGCAGMRDVCTPIDWLFFHATWVQRLTCSSSRGRRACKVTFSIDIVDIVRSMRVLRIASTSCRGFVKYIAVQLQ